MLIYKIFYGMLMVKIKIPLLTVSLKIKSGDQVIPVTDPLLACTYTMGNNMSRSDLVKCSNNEYRIPQRSIDVPNIEGIHGFLFRFFMKGLKPESSKGTGMKQMYRDLDNLQQTNCNVGAVGMTCVDLSDFIKSPEKGITIEKSMPFYGTDSDSHTMLLSVHRPKLTLNNKTLKEMSKIKMHSWNSVSQRIESVEAAGSKVTKKFLKHILDPSTTDAGSEEMGDCLNSFRLLPTLRASALGLEKMDQGQWAYSQQCMRDSVARHFAHYVMELCTNCACAIAAKQGVKISAGTAQKLLPKTIEGASDETMITCFRESLRQYVATNCEYTFDMQKTLQTYMDEYGATHSKIVDSETPGEAFNLFGMPGMDQQMAVHEIATVLERIDSQLPVVGASQRKHLQGMRNALQRMAVMMFQDCEDMGIMTSHFVAAVNKFGQLSAQNFKVAMLSVRNVYGGDFDEATAITHAVCKRMCSIPGSLDCMVSFVLAGSAALQLVQDSNKNAAVTATETLRQISRSIQLQTIAGHAVAEQGHSRVGAWNGAERYSTKTIDGHTFEIVQFKKHMTHFIEGTGHMQEAFGDDIKPVEMYANADDIPLAIKMSGLNAVMPKNVVQNQLIQMLAQNLSSSTCGEMEVKNAAMKVDLRKPSWYKWQLTSGEHYLFHVSPESVGQCDARQLTSPVALGVPYDLKYSDRINVYGFTRKLQQKEKHDIKMLVQASSCMSSTAQMQAECYQKTGISLPPLSLRCVPSDWGEHPSIMFDGYLTALPAKAKQGGSLEKAWMEEAQAREKFVAKCLSAHEITKRSDWDIQHHHATAFAVMVRAKDFKFSMKK